VLEFRKLASFKFLSIKCRLSSIEVSKESPVVNRSNEEDHLGPAKSRDGINGSNTVGDRRAWDSWGNVEWEAVNFLDNVTNYGKLGNTSVLEFRSAVLSKGLFVNVGGKSKRIEESSRSNYTKLVLVGGCKKSTLGGSLGGRVFSSRC